MSATSRLQVDTDALRAYRAQLDSAATAFRGVEGAMNGISRSAAHLQLSATAAEFGVDWASSVEAIKADFEEVGDAIAAVGATLESAESELARLARQGAAAAWEGITAQATSALNVLSAPRRFIGNSARTLIARFESDRFPGIQPIHTIAALTSWTLSGFPGGVSQSAAEVDSLRRAVAGVAEDVDRMAARVAGEFQSLATDQLYEALRDLAAQAEHEASRLAIVAEALSYYSDALAAAINVKSNLVYYAQQVVRAREEADDAVQHLDRQIDAHRNERGWFSGFGGPDPEWQARLTDLTGQRNWAHQELAGLNNRISDIEAQLIAAHQKHTAAGDESASKIAGQFENAPSLPRAFWNSWRNDARDTAEALRTIRDHLTIEQWREFGRRVRRLGWREAIRVTAWDFVINGGLAASGTLLGAASVVVKTVEKGPQSIVVDVLLRGFGQLAIEQSERIPRPEGEERGALGTPPLLPPPTGVSEMLKGIGNSLKNQSLPKGRSEWDWRRQSQGNTMPLPLETGGGIFAQRPTAPNLTGESPGMPPGLHMSGGMGRGRTGDPDFDFNLPSGYVTLLLDGERQSYPELDARIDEIYGSEGLDTSEMKSFATEMVNVLGRQGTRMFAIQLGADVGYPPPMTTICVDPITEPVEHFLERQRDRGLRIMESRDSNGVMYRASHVELGKLTTEYCIFGSEDSPYHITFRNSALDMRRELLGYFDYLIEGITPRAETV